MRARTTFGAALAAIVLVTLVIPATFAASPTYDINTLAGKVASLHGTAGLQVRFSAFLEEEAEESEDAPPPGPAAPISPNIVLSSPLDGTSIAPPNIRVNQDSAAAPQNETSIAVDPNNPNRIVGSANDYVTRRGPARSVARRAVPSATATPGPITRTTAARPGAARARIRATSAR